MAKTQVVRLPDGERTWTVLGADHLPIAVAEGFLEHLRSWASPNTVRAYAKGLQLWWEFLDHQGVAWDDVALGEFAGFRTWLRSGPPPPAGVAPPAGGSPEARKALAESTVGLRLNAVLAFYRHREDLDGLGDAVLPYRCGERGRRRSPYKPFLDHLSGRTTARRRPLVVAARGTAAAGRPTPLLAPAQVELILAGCATWDPGAGEWRGSLRDRLLFALLAETGMRLGEALALRHEDWRVGRGDTPCVEVVPRPHHPHGLRVKGQRYRRLYVSDALERLYSDYLWALCEAGAVREVADLDSWWVFVNLRRGERFAPLRPAGVYETVARLKRRHGRRLPAGWTPHWLRHTHATALLLNGTPPHVVQRRLGHADVQTTLGTYGWVTEDAEMRALADWHRYAEGWRGLGLGEQAG